MSPETGYVIAAVTIINIAAAMWLLWAMRGRRTGASTDTTGHVWDHDLKELNSPLPKWWLWLFVITVVFGLGYFAYYGLANWTGTSGWSSQAQWQAQTADAERVLAKTFAPFESKSVEDLQTDPDALRIGRNLFVNNCAQCHGTDGRGAPGFPNLADSDWLWGGDADAVHETIANGRMGVMAPWSEALGAQGVENVLAYVLSLSGRKIETGDAAQGAAKFAEICSACHGPDGRGNPALGAPNLTDQVWLHGGSIDTIRSTIAQGRMGQMPAQSERLGDTRVKILAAYVRSLSAGAPARVADASAH